MSKRVNALTDEMEPIWVPLAIDDLEVEDPLEKELMCSYQLLPRDSTLMDDTDRPNEPTEVIIIEIRENAIEHARSEAVDVVEEFPSLITTWDLLLGIPRRTAERSWQILRSFCNDPAVSLPHISFKYSPGPGRAIIIASSRPGTPEINEKSGHVNQGLVHEIAREASGKREGARYPRKNTWLSYTCIIATPPVFGLVARRDDVQQVCLVFFGVRGRQRVDVDIGVWGGSVRLEACRSQKGWIVVGSAVLISSL
jgi:hypothetical protein